MGSALTLGDRRQTPRRGSPHEHGVTAVRVRPGIHAHLVDMSAGGAQLEMADRLVPGRFVHLQLTLHSGQVTVRARVLRNDVRHVTADRIGYRCGVCFDRPLQWTASDGLWHIAHATQESPMSDDWCVRGIGS